MQSWVDKYTPTHSSNFVANHDAINEIKGWLRSYKSGNPVKGNLLVTGNHGVGKTTAVKLLIEEAGYQVEVLSSAKIKAGRIVHELIGLYTKSSDIFHEMCGEQSKKYALVIDQIEIINSTIEKGNINLLYKENEKNHHLPIIFISNDQHNKLLSDLKKACLVTRFRTPTRAQLLELLEHVAYMENMTVIEGADGEIIKHSQGDIRRMVNILQELYNAHGRSTITDETMENFLLTSKKKDTDINLFKATRQLLTSYRGIESSLLLHETDKALLPPMIHENYYRTILTKSRNKTQRLRTMAEISDALSAGDIIENQIFSDQIWDLQEVHGFFTCALTSFQMEQMEDDPAYDIGSLPDFDFAQDLNKTSIKKINRKNISNVEDIFPHKKIPDFIYMNMILKHLIKKKDINEIANILHGYPGITADKTDSLLKIDKLRNQKNNLTNRDKKLLQDRFDELSSYSC